MRPTATPALILLGSIACRPREKPAGATLIPRPDGSPGDLLLAMGVGGAMSGRPQLALAPIQREGVGRAS